MKMKSNRILAAITCSILAGTALADDDFRCGSRIVRVGATQAGVLDACGQPDTKAVEKVDVHSGNRVVGQTEVWRWTYTMNGRTRVLTFDQEKLKSID
ncbi:MAG: DUF2845 domain-containing protein [Steroidobacteraceae bacterium]|nr:DUF2845 domain-containing protein [Steroidobacteraceae bacterium]